MKKTEIIEETKTLNVFQKLNRVRVELHAAPLKKSGNNTFAKYQYFELGDFLPTAIRLMDAHGLIAIDDFGDRETATLTIIDTDRPEDRITFRSTIASADLKGCHPVQNLGAQQTYIRRYLYTMALEIVEHDALDATTGRADQVDPPTPKVTFKLDPAVVESVNAAESVEVLNEIWKGLAVGVRSEYKAIFTASRERIAGGANA